MQIRILLVLAALAVALPACGPEGEDDGPGTQPPAHDEDTCTDFIVPSRIGMGWRDFNHRISLWSLRLDRDAAERCNSDLLKLHYIGGDFTTGETRDDAPHVHYSFQRVAGADNFFVGAASVSVPLRFERVDEVTGQQQYSRDELNLEGYEGVVALIEGLDLRTGVEQRDDYPDDYDPAHGYTSRGIGVDVEVTALDDETITLDYTVRFASGTNDRPDMNRAIPFADNDGALDVLLVGYNETTPLRGTVDYSLEYEEPVAFDPQVIDPAPIEDQRVVIEGDPTVGAGIYGMSRFWFVLDPPLTCILDQDCSGGETCSDDMCSTDIAEPGYYIRELTTGVELESYNADSGVASFLFNGYVSNSSVLAFKALHTQFDGELVWLQLDGAGDQVSFDEQLEVLMLDIPLADYEGE